MNKFNKFLNMIVKTCKTVGIKTQTVSSKYICGLQEQDDVFRIYPCPYCDINLSNDIQGAKNILKEK